MEFSLSSISAIGITPQLFQQCLRLTVGKQRLHGLLYAGIITGRGLIHCGLKLLALRGLQQCE